MPGEDQEGAQHHRHRIERVAEEQDELLDEGDLDDMKPKPSARK